MQSGGTPTSIQAAEIRRRLWRNSWICAAVIFIVSWLYQLASGEAVDWFSFSKTLAGTGGVLIAASFVLSGFCYYFDFLDTKLGYRKYLGLIGFYFAAGYSFSLAWLYPELYGVGLPARLAETEVVLGLAAMVILAGMAVISNTKIMMFMGPNAWRQCLRLGYLAMLLFVWRAYLMESDIWFAWLSAPRGLPPGRLVLSIIDLGVIGLRGSMLISQYWRRYKAAASHAASSAIPLGRVRLWSLLTVLAAAVLVYFFYNFLTIRPVLAPDSPLIQPPVSDTSGQLPSEPIGSPPAKLLTDPELYFLELPPGFIIQIFASGELSPSILSRPGPGVGPRLMSVVGEMVLVAVPGQGTIVALRDTSGDGRADWQQEFVGGLRRPHNVVWHDYWYYIATEDSVLRIRADQTGLKADASTLERLINLPTGGHWTRTVKIINGQMYIAVGSSCNVCHETDDRRAAITRCELDGGSCITFASGLRNTVDFVERNGAIYGTDNGRDQLGNTLPPEEVNQIIEGGNYGWPICYGQKIHDTNFDKNVYIRDPCADSIPPLVELPAHIAPLGLAFYDGKDFPTEYQGDLFIASHGSWNRQPPDGYKIFRVDWQTKQVSDFMTGFLGGTVVRGRPVGVVNYQGGLLISDDAAGVIYFVRYSP